MDTIPEEEAIMVLYKRYERNNDNLWFGLKGRNPPSPAIVTTIESTEDRAEVLLIQRSLGTGNIHKHNYHPPSLTIDGCKGIELMKKLRPLIKASPSPLDKKTNKLNAIDIQLRRWRVLHPETDK